VRDSDPAPGMRLHHRGSLRSRGGLTLLAVFILALLGVALVGNLYYSSQRASIVEQKALELSAIRDLKIDQIIGWRNSLQADAETAAHDPAVTDELAAWLADPGDVRAESLLRGWVDNKVARRGYTKATIISLDGSAWVSNTGAGAPDEAERREARVVAASLESTITDLFLDESSGRPRLDVIAPLHGLGSTNMAVLVLTRDPEDVLYPLIQSWPTPSPSSETLLIREEAGTVLYLNELRFRKGAALKLSLPLARRDLPAAMAVTGESRVVEGVDYRGHHVLAALGKVPDFDWFLVAKVDTSEAYAAVFDTQRNALVGVGLLVLVVAFGFGLAWRQRTASLLREQVETERAARQLAEQYDLLTQYANDAVLLADGDLRIVQANDRATTMFGYGRDELLDMTLEDLREPGSRDEARRNVEALKQEGSRIYETRLVCKDGEVRDIEVSARALISSGKELYLFIERDITERKKAEAQLQARTEDLVRSNAELEKFAYVASHDLQEPLRMVASYTQLLQKRYQGQLDSDADEFIGYAVDGANRMQRLINDLLAYSRVGTQGSPFVPTDLERVLGDVLQGLERAIEDAGAVVTHDPMPTVRCDPTQMGQVFQNLISNALKFHGSEPPRIHVGVSMAANEWVFCVKDNGIGIETEYFDRIFVIFQRLQSRAEYPGTGMGLAICKRIIERHGGRIWVESRPGEGSTFYFTLRDPGEE